MNGLDRLAPAVAVAGLLFVASSQDAAAQSSAPTENKGIVTEQLHTIELGPEIPAMSGHYLRMRKITVAPGGVIALHDHIDRPAIDYLLQGSLIDHRGAEAKEYGPGTTIFETTKTVHWLENKGTVAAVFVTADLPTKL